MYSREIVEKLNEISKKGSDKVWIFYIEFSKHPRFRFKYHVKPEEVTFEIVGKYGFRFRGCSKDMDYFKGDLFGVYESEEECRVAYSEKLTSYSQDFIERKNKVDKEYDRFIERIAKLIDEYEEVKQ